MLDKRTSVLDVSKVSQFVEHLHDKYFETKNEIFTNSARKNEIKPIRHLSELPQAKSDLINRSDSVRKLDLDRRTVDTAISGLIAREFLKSKEKRVLRLVDRRYASLPALEDPSYIILEKTVLGRKEIVREEAF